jgi:hypothetical protein
LLFDLSLPNRLSCLLFYTASPGFTNVLYHFQVVKLSTWRCQAILDTL